MNHIFAGIFCLGLAGAIVHAETNRIVSPALLSEDSINLSGQAFLDGFASSQAEIRLPSRVYLLGVLDATEGKSWCGYSILKTASLHEFIFEQLKKQSAKQLEQRASALIEEALHYSFPCKKTNETSIRHSQSQSLFV